MSARAIGCDAVSVELALAAAVAVGLLVYLTYALIRPEKF
jgi:K+-transporting ATPase KdpF subunit